jgi:hypothetical protein
MTEERKALVERAKAERRRFRRVSVDLDGKLFVPGDGREAPCKVLDLSPGGAQIRSDFVLPADTQLVLYVDGFGRLEGHVARPVEGAPPAEGCFGVKFNCSPLKRERIAEQLMLVMNKGVVEESALRRHERSSTGGMASFTRANGEVVACEVLDLSLSGVSLKTDNRAPIGETVLIGQMSGRVVRHHEKGVAIEFIRPSAERAPAEQRPRIALSS